MVTGFAYHGNFIMNRVEVEVQAPWALRYYDEGVASGKTNPEQASFSFANQWIDINDHAPDIDQVILYYVSGQSVALGHYRGPADDERQEHQIVSGNGLLLRRDITYWMPTPLPPSSTY